MPSVSKQVAQLNEALKALDANQGWGLGIAKELAQKSTNAHIKNLAKDGLEERGIRV
ncbi:hypothetical protein [Kiloniella antarctica]|uniref:Uncharacterized protein n=1 Tax=Kiloniella antarctica TaxID=1550907 RepID=A0ABW5BP01_9PROT